MQELPTIKDANWLVIAPVSIVAVQTAAAIYFVADGISDWVEAGRTGMSGEILAECMVALALIVTIALAAYLLKEGLQKQRRQEAALSVARGTMSELVQQRFGEWGLSRSEADVALFALKGYRVKEIADLRKAAEGTVRSQLSQIYAKAGASSQTMLMAVFFEDLI